MIAALFGVGVLTGGGDEKGERRPELPVDVGRVAHRLERVRGLEFDEIPPVRVVSGTEARDEGLSEIDETYPEARRRADEEVLILLGLLPPESDLRALAGSVFGEEVAGYYDERRKRMTLVLEAFERDETFGELILAHELTHALEDQHFRLKPEPGQVDDEATAHLALVEGTATIAMIDYGVKYLRGGVAASRSQALQGFSLGELLSSESLPPYLQHSLVFPYFEGARFVDAIGTWRPANRALDSRPPASTEQIIHPGKYRTGEEPQPVEVGPGPGGGWKRTAAGAVGEFDTSELIRTSDTLPRAERAAAGWGGGRYELWQRAGLSTLLLGWRWDSRRDAAEFVAALPRYIEQTLRGEPAGPGRWRTPEDDVVTVETGDTVRLAIAPAR